MALPGQSLNASQLRAHVAQLIGNHAAPKTFLQIHELPRNRNGNVDRAGVLELFVTRLKREPGMEEWTK